MREPGQAPPITEVEVHGRIVGSFLSLLTAITFFAISVYTSGDILIGALDELAGTGQPEWLLAIGYGFVAGATAYAGDGYSPEVAGATAAFIGSVLLVMANPLSFGAFLGDWSRGVWA